jgi:hypothetical protein
MSRLDDELKIAFRRREPSPDFTARLMERINSSPAPRPNLRQRLAALFETPRFRLVAIGATAVLLVAIGAAQYRRLHQTAADKGGEVATVSPPASVPDAGPAPVEKTPKAVAARESRINRGEPRKFRTRAIAVRRGPRPSPEAEAARERVLFALQVAGATLNDVQRVIRDDGPKDKPEPFNNR